MMVCSDMYVWLYVCMYGCMYVALMEVDETFAVVDGPAVYDHCR